MRCFSPLNLPDDRYPGERIYRVVPCGKCAACKTNYRDSWSYRLQQESKYNNGSQVFVTLTYESNPRLDKKDIQLFLKRLRKAISPTKLRYFIVGELGSHTQREHYHGLFFFDCYGDFQSKILKSWSHGFISLGKVNPATIHYTTKYMIDFENDTKFVMMSRNPGIGEKFVSNENVVKSYRANPRTFCSSSRYKVSMPRYYKDKLFNPDEFDGYIPPPSTSAQRKVYDEIVRDWEKDRKNLLNGSLSEKEKREEAYTRNAINRSKYKK